MANTATINKTAAAPKKKKKMGAQVLKRLWDIPTARFGLFILVLLVVLSLVSPLICRWGFDEMDLRHINEGPTSRHFFGTDALGRDCLSRLLYGGRYSLGLGFGSCVISTVAGLILGSVAGYFGGWTDNIILRACELIQAIPSNLLAVIISATFGGGFFTTVVALSIGGIPGGTRILRAQILSVRQEEYIEAAQSVNCSSGRIMFRHILPNVLSPVIVSTTMGMGNTIMMAAGLSFIGLGVQPPTPEWGAMLSEGRNVIRNYPHLALFPGLFIFITVLCFNLFGDGLRDAIDPKLKK